MKMQDENRVFSDEKIIGLIDETEIERQKSEELPANGLETDTKLDIQQGVVMINGKPVNFERTAILNNKLSIILPKDFNNIPPETIYKPETKPDLLLVNKSGTIQITVARTKKTAANNDELTAYSNEVKQAVKTMTPGSQWFEEFSMDLSDTKVIGFELLTSMLNSGVYILTYFLELDHKVLTGSFNCAEIELKSWRPIFKQMLGSISINR